MHCQKCNTMTKVIDSRKKDDAVRRRRVCPSCGDRFTTVEHRIDSDEYINRDALYKILSGTIEFRMKALFDQAREYVASRKGKGKQQVSQLPKDTPRETGQRGKRNDHPTRDSDI